MAGKKTSVWLGQTELDEWKNSGASLTDIVKRGLAAMREDAGAAPADAATAQEVQAIVREEVSAISDSLRRIVLDAIRDAAMGG
jgi:hypothetical protein